jgi:hypothetical protein
MRESIANRQPYHVSLARYDFRALADLQVWFSTFSTVSV